jgi:predicted alpha/beta hydrolase
VLAAAHARSGDAASIGGYLGTGTAFDDALVRFAGAYADQAEHDHAAFVAAVKAGTIPATS